MPSYNGAALIILTLEIYQKICMPIYIPLYCNRWFDLNPGERYELAIDALIV
jgi:hypothetical protein